MLKKPPAVPPPAVYEALMRAAAQTGIPVRLLVAVAWIESRYNLRARSVKGAMGLMQLMPATARAMGVVDPWDAEQNALGGATELQRLYAHYQHWRDVLAAYNWGEDRVDKHPDADTWPGSVREYVNDVFEASGAALLPFLGDALMVVAPSHVLRSHPLFGGATPGGVRRV